jgi:hypothetical protein
MSSGTTLMFSGNRYSFGPEVNVETGVCVLKRARPAAVAS